MGRYAVIIVISLALLMSYTSISLNNAKQSATENIVEYFDRNRAQNLANSYANIYIQEMHQDTTWSPNWPTYDAGKGIAHKKDLDDERTVVAIKEEIPVDATSIYSVEGQQKITVIATVNSVTCSTEVVDNPVPYSYYAWFLNTWNSNLFLGNGESINGPVRTNEGFGIGGVPGPIVDGNITISDKLFAKYGAKKDLWLADPDHFGGDWLKEDQDQIPFDASDVMISNDTKSKALDLDNLPGLDYGSLQESGRLYATLLDNGEIMMSTKRFPDNLSVGQAYLYSVNHPNWVTIIDTNQINSGEDVLHSDNYDISVKGIVKGQYTISTDQGIKIEDDIVYTTDPRFDPDCSDLLSLMSHDKIDIASGSKKNNNPIYEYFNGTDWYEKIPNNNSASDTLYVMANMTTLDAIGPEVKPQNFASGDARGLWLTIGSRVQDKVIGTWSHTGSPYAGFKESIYYDPRLRNLVPPGMPYTANRRIVSWTGTL